MTSVRTVLPCPLEGMDMKKAASEAARAMNAARWGRLKTKAARAEQTAKARAARAAGRTASDVVVGSIGAEVAEAFAAAITKGKR